MHISERTTTNTILVVKIPTEFPKETKEENRVDILTTSSDSINSNAKKGVGF